MHERGASEMITFILSIAFVEARHAAALLRRAQLAMRSVNTTIMRRSLAASRAPDGILIVDCWLDAAFHWDEGRVDMMPLLTIFITYDDYAHSN